MPGGVAANYFSLGRPVVHPAGTTLNMLPARVQHHWFDSTAAQNNAQLPSAGFQDGDVVILKNIGASVAAPMLITARGGQAVETIGTGSGLGNFSAANGQTNYSGQGGTVVLIYSATETAWGCVGVSV